MLRVFWKGGCNCVTLLLCISIPHHFHSWYSFSYCKIQWRRLPGSDCIRKELLGSLHFVFCPMCSISSEVILGYPNATIKYDEGLWIAISLKDPRNCSFINLESNLGCLCVSEKVNENQCKLHHDRLTCFIYHHWDAQNALPKWQTPIKACSHWWACMIWISAVFGNMFFIFDPCTYVHAARDPSRMSSWHQVSPNSTLPAFCFA